MAVVIVLAAALVACSPFDAAEAGDAGDAGPPNEAGPDASDAGLTDGAASARCPSGRGPAMADLGSFCIDKTEVTIAQYDVFVASAASHAEGAGCAPQASHTPSCMPAGQTNVPVGCVTWCSAFAYCSWAGKRLCGRRDGAGAITAREDLRDPVISEWAFACTEGTAREFPYGVAYLPRSCFDKTTAAGATQPVSVGTSPGCVTAAGVVDLGGNVAEWVDGTSAGAHFVAGDTYGYTESGQRASSCRNTDSIDDATPITRDVGIRCCADLVR